MKKILSIMLLIIMALTACESRPDPVYSSEHLGITIDYILDAGIDGLNSHREIGDNQVAFTPEERDYSKEINFVYNIDSRYIEEIQMSMQTWEDIDEYMSIIFNLFGFGEYDISENGEKLRNACASSLDAYDSQELMGGVYYYVALLEDASATEGNMIYIKMNRHRFENDITDSENSSTQQQEEQEDSEDDDTIYAGTLEAVQHVMGGDIINSYVEVEDGYFSDAYEINDNTELYVIYDEEEYVDVAWILSDDKQIPTAYIRNLGIALYVDTEEIRENIDLVNDNTYYVVEEDGWKTIVGPNTETEWLIMFTDMKVPGFEMEEFPVGATSVNENAGSESSTSENTEDPNESTNSALSKIYPEGMYRVGTDIPEGIYYIYTDSSCYWEVSSDSTGDFGSIIGNGNISNNAYVTVYEGQYLTVNRGSFYNISTRKYELQSSVGEGMYWVGHDIPAGEYVLTPEAGESAYWAIYSSSESRRDIMANGNEDTTIYITVSDGQFLEINRGSIELVQ